MTRNPFHSDCPPEAVERGLEALDEGIRRRYPGAVTIEPASPSSAINADPIVSGEPQPEGDVHS